MPEFTTSQQEAIDYRRQDACVVAGPGSGKTTVLVERYRSLIETHGFDSRNILAITFTEKAAANMKAKLAELFAHNPIRLRDLESAWVSTIHGFCARILRENAIAAGIDPRFSVLDARESEDLQSLCLQRAFDELVDLRRAEALQLIAALYKPDLAWDLRNAYDAIRSAGKSIADVRAMRSPAVSLDPRHMAAELCQMLAAWPSHLTPARQTQRQDLLAWAQELQNADPCRLSDITKLLARIPLHLGKVPESEKVTLGDFRERLKGLVSAAVDRHTERFRAMIFDVLSRFEALYSERKKNTASLDFNDLERRAVELLRSETEVRNRIQKQFRQVMLDEFQDINAQQSDLIDLVRGADVFFAVGDVNQSIYGFRHARPDIFHEYRRQVDAAGKHATRLSHNFRSRAEILRCVEATLSAADGIEPHELVAGLAFQSKKQPSIEVLKVRDPDKDEAAAKEASWIAHRIISLHATLRLGANGAGAGRAAEFRDFAVLCRNSDSMRPILDAFNDAGIPYICGRRQSFLLSREGLDITALLHVIANPRDAIALATVLRSNLVGVSDEALLRMRMLAASSPIGPKVVTHEHRRLAGSLPGGLNMLAHDQTKLAEFVPADAQKLERFILNLKRWRAAQPVTPLAILLPRALSDCGLQWIPGSVIAANIESFLQLARTKGADRSLNDFMREIESLQKDLNHESDLSDADQGDCVQVMTAHAAKGLEFPVTIIAAMEKGTQRNSAPATFTPDFGLGLKWREPEGKPGNNGLDDSWQHYNTGHLDEREKREANRLLYVAMTRAEEHLILSYSRGKKRPSNWAKLIEEMFRMDTRTPSEEPEIDTFTTLNGGAFNVSIRVTEGDPPPLRATATSDSAGGELLTIPRPIVKDQHDSTASVTSLTVFADCPRKYYLQRYIGWNGTLPARIDPEDLPSEDDDSSGLSAADLGSIVHEILAGKPGPQPEEAVQLASTFLSSDLGKRAAQATRVEREWDFIAHIRGTLLRGTIDLWFEEDGEMIVVDYKTDTRPRPEAYAPQLALYALAIERAFGKRPAEAWLYFLRSEQAVRVPVDDAAIERVEHLLSDLMHAQDTLQFSLNEGEHCRACQFYRGLCPAGHSA